MHAEAVAGLGQLFNSRVQVINGYTSGTMNPTTFVVTLPADEVAWEGPALITTAASSNETGGVQVDELNVRCPAEAPDVEPGAIIRVMQGSDALLGEDLIVTRSAARTGPGLHRYTVVRRQPWVSIPEVS